MAREIQCSVPGCTEPVVGQCTGYKSTCLRFYCAQHSSGTLCSECASQKAYDKEVQRIYEDYLRTAKSIPRVGCGFWVIVTGAIGTLLLVVSRVANPGARFYVGSIFLCALPIIVVLAINVVESIAARKVKKISEEKPGFEEFYRLWRKQKSEEELLTAAAIGIAALGAAAGAYEAHQRQQLYRDVHEIKKKL